MRIFMLIGSNWKLVLFQIMPPDSTSMIAFAVYRISVLFLGTRRHVPNYILSFGTRRCVPNWILSFGTRRLRNDAQTHLLPQKFLTNLHIVEQLGLVGFSFLAESFYQNYQGMIRIWHGDIAVYARTDWSFSTRRSGNNPSQHINARTSVKQHTPELR
jgi:hypothetical protein